MWRAWFSRFVRDESGQTTIEYILVLTVSVAVFASMWRTLSNLVGDRLPRLVGEMIERRLGEGMHRIDLSN